MKLYIKKTWVQRHMYAIFKVTGPHCPETQKVTENYIRHEVSGKLGSETVPNRPHCPLTQRSRPFWEKCFQNIEIAIEKIFENWKILYPRRCKIKF